MEPHHVAGVEEGGPVALPDPAGAGRAGNRAGGSPERPGGRGPCRTRSGGRAAIDGWGRKPSPKTDPAAPTWTHLGPDVKTGTFSCV